MAMAGQGLAADLSIKAPMAAPVEVRNWYFELEGGGAILDPRSQNAGLVYGTPSPPYILQLGTSTGFDAGVRLGYQFTPMFRGDLSFNYMGWTIGGRILCGPGLNGCNGTGPTSTPDNASLNATRTAHSFVGMANGYIDFAHLFGPHFNRVNPYITAGVGFASNHLDANCVSCDFGAGNGASTHNSFAWDAGAGARIDLFPEVKLDIAYRYYDLGKFVGGFNSVPFSASRFNGPTGGETFRANVHTVTAGIILPF
jgi:opacity protein-like surface antigen